MKRLLFVIFAGAAAGAACRASPEASPTAATQGSMIVADDTAPKRSTAQEALDRLDTRSPVPLLPMMANHQKQNMRDHLLAVQQILAGVVANDFDGIETATKRISYSEEMGAMCTHMGAGAPGFNEQALLFHHTADKIGDAARARDMKAVLSALSETMSTCTGCHATFKQSVVDDDAFAAASMATHSPSAGSR